MKTITELISSRLPLLIIITAISTYFSPIYLKTTSWLPSLLLGIVIFFTGLSMDIRSIKGIVSMKRQILLATLLKWSLTVLVSIGIAINLFPNKPEIASGLILSGTVPSATAATVYTFLAGGNTLLVIAASLFDVGISPLVTPLAMFSVPGHHVTISIYNLLKSFVMIVFLPLGLGLLTQKILPNLAANSKNITKLGSSISLLLIVHSLIGKGKGAISSEIGLLPLIIAATIIQVLAPMAIAYLIAKKLRVYEADARAILFHVGLCNTALAAILAFNFIGQAGVIPPIINVIINLSLGAFISNHLSKREIVTSPQKSYNL